MSRDSKKTAIGELIDAYRANTAQEGAFDAMAAERLGISLTDLRCLEIVEARSGVTAGELADASGLTTGAVTAVIDRLERVGYAERVRDPDDRRKVRVAVTNKHYAATEEIWRPLMEDWFADLGKRFTLAEIASITEFLQGVTRIGNRHAERIASLSER